VINCSDVVHFKQLTANVVQTNPTSYLYFISKHHTVKTLYSQVLVAHTCNPSYSGGRDQEIQGLKSSWANSLRNPISKKTITKRGW
jgi:hypothetical protein